MGLLKAGFYRFYGAVARETVAFQALFCAAAQIVPGRTGRFLEKAGVAG
ncbi:hypothetical protein MICA_1521 [Micavibrio aeruginosavorus ARL-13]|uniref:Uncharacterized protein n=1 Tax=Micavibrio aeruginosavorus (strain ARL-13) TaxID=856793 RepID=G2KNJ1_MICAA|nr:hypothetical protein MICA_1521 [Micavibrio aeruginosavorus ARL-13]